MPFNDDFPFFASRVHRDRARLTDGCKSRGVAGEGMEDQCRSAERMSR